MMPGFSRLSRERLGTCDPRLQEILREAIRYTDFTVLVGHRGKEDQERAKADGFSKVGWPRSKHNHRPSLAVDVAPYPIDWKNRERFYYLGGVLMGIALEKGFACRYGGDWNRNGEIRDESFHDLGHLELVD